MIEDIMAIPLFGEGLGQMIVDNTASDTKTHKVHALIIVSSNTDFISKNVKTVGNAIEKAVDDSGFGSDPPIIVGGPLIMDEVQAMMSDTMPIMLGLAIILLFVLLAAIFKIRGFFAWRWLPLGVVLIGLIYTFGVMGFLSVPLTMVSMAVFPVMLGLGIDYGIQLHNRYDEDSIDKSPAQAIIHAITHMGPAVGIALVASCLGLAAMFFSPMLMVRDFGLMLIIGMIASYMVAVFPLPVILYWHHRGKHNNNGNGEAKAKQIKVIGQKMGFLEKGLHRIAPWIIRSPKIILPIALILAAAGVVADYYMEVSFDETEFLSESSPVMQKINKLAEVDQGLVLFNILVEGDDLAQPETMDWISGVKQAILTDKAADDDHIKYADEVNTIADTIKQTNGGTMPSTSDEIRTVLDEIPDVQKSNLVVLGDDGISYAAANIMIPVNEWDTDIVPGFRDKLIEYTAEPPEGVSVAVTGQPILNAEIKSAMTNSRSRITFFSIAFIFIGLFLMFRFDIIKAIIATLPVVLIVGWSALTMYTLGMNYTPLTAALGAMAIAIGVEFTILLMSRYYEERAKGEGPTEAMTTAMTRIGRAIAASALTTIGGFAALLFAFDFLILQDFGIITMINVFFALVVTIFVLPSLVVIVDRWREKRKQARIG
jgi:hydrophobe/amphiphile efflux-3 (HAE3) family protein